ncbi:MAG: LptA/OstA family protein [Desulfonatronovibrionaceae bacterium]
MRIPVMAINLFAVFMLTAFPAAALEIDTAGSTDITSDRMTYAGQEQEIIFAGNVHVVRDDFELWADELTVFLDPEAQEGDSDSPEASIQKIIARDNVKITNLNRTATGDSLTYLSSTGIATLKGDPRLVEGRNSIEGQTIILNTRNNTSEVLGGPEERVRVLFHPEQQQE